MKVDVHSRGEIWSFLEKWLIAKAIKPCQNIRLEKTHAGYYKTICTEDCASRVPAPNIDYINWDGVRMTYTWPKCPPNCQRFKQSADFPNTAIRDQWEDQQQKRQNQQQAARDPKPIELLPPPNYTAQWVWKHGSISVWLWFFGLLGAAFLLGFGIGHWVANIEHPTVTANAPSSVPSAVTVRPPITAVKAATTKK